MTPRDYICPTCDHASSRDTHVMLCPRHQAEADGEGAIPRVATLTAARDTPPTGAGT